MNIAEFEQWLAGQIAHTVRRDQDDPTKEVISWPINGSWSGELRRMLVGAFEAGLKEGRTLAGVDAIEKLASCVKDGVIQMRDVDRADVYSKHLGEGLRK